MDPEKAPLLAEKGAALPSAAKEPRQWKGQWYNLAGDCGAGDAAACCLAFNVPQVAFGWNASRGLGLTWWKEALKLLLLSVCAYFLVHVVTDILIHTQCHPHPPHGAMMPHNMMMSHELPGAVGSGAAVGSKPFVPTNLRGHWGGAVNPTQAGPNTVSDANQAVEHFVERGEHDDHEDDAGVAFMRGFLHGRDRLHRDDDMKMMSDDDMAECAVRIAPAASVAIALGIAMSIYTAYFAALRRRMTREKFGIEGSFRGDWLLWLCCAPCALTQETRTLMHNNVEQGLWHGPLVVPPQAAPMSA